MKVKLDLGRTSDDIVHHQLVDVQFNRLLGDKGRLRTHSWLRFTAATTKIICQTQLWTHTHIYIYTCGLFSFRPPFLKPSLSHLTEARNGRNYYFGISDDLTFYLVLYFKGNGIFKS